MSETTLETTAEVVAEAKKPYEFRKLGAPDVFDMVRIINKIGIKDFKACIEGDGIKGIIRQMVEDKKAEAEKAEAEKAEAADESSNDESVVIEVGVGVAMEIASVLFEKLPCIETDLYKLLAQTSNLSVDEIKAPGNAVMFLEMVVDFLQKEEFPDFIRVVSKLF